MSIFFVVGTRPEIVKMAPIIKICDGKKIEYFVLHTGQHYSKNMSDFFIEDLGLTEPDKNLNIGSGTQAEQTANALVGIEKELNIQKPDVVLVQGDTNAVLSATLASVKLQIPVGHVEAGLRSYDIRMPEEHNRRVTDHCSKYLFAPTERSAKILKSENVWGDIFITGNTVIDALENRLPTARKRPDVIGHLKLNEFCLLTLHRAENVDSKAVLDGIITGLLELDENIVFPAHPRTIARLEQFDLMNMVKQSERIHIINPLGYLDFLNMMTRCAYVLTDSGGIQEEVTAPSINKRAFVLRTSTERPEAVDSGHVTVVGVNPDVFPEQIKSLTKSELKPSILSPYGKGDASKKIIDILINELSL